MASAISSAGGTGESCPLPALLQPRGDELPVHIPDGGGREEHRDLQQQDDTVTGGEELARDGPRERSTTPCRPWPTRAAGENERTIEARSPGGRLASHSTVKPSEPPADRKDVHRLHGYRDQPLCPIAWPVTGMRTAGSTALVAMTGVRGPRAAHRTFAILSRTLTLGPLRTERRLRLYLPFVVAGELAAGLSLADRNRWEAFLAPFYVLASNADVSWEYGRACRYLQENGRLIGGNDLWIAATGLAYRMPVLTRNVEHYRRVPGLDVEAY